MQESASVVPSHTSRGMGQGEGFPGQPTGFQPDMDVSKPGLVRRFPGFPAIGARHLQVWLEVLQVEPEP